MAIGGKTLRKGRFQDESVTMTAIISKWQRRRCLNNRGEFNAVWCYRRDPQRKPHNGYILSVLTVTINSGLYRLRDRSWV